MSTTNLMSDSEVKKTVNRLENVRSLQDLNTLFKTLCRDLLKMGHEINKRILSSDQGKRMWRSVEKIISNLIIIQLSLPMFHKLMQHYVCNSLNPLAKGGKVFAIRQISFLLDGITDSQRNWNDVEEDDEEDKEKPGMFVKTVDNILQIVPEEMSSFLTKQQLSIDVNRLLSFSTEVAHLSESEEQRNLIHKHCEDVLKTEGKVQEWKAETSTTTTENDICEMFSNLSQKIEMLELKVNISILEQIVDTFVRPTRKLKNVFEAIVNHKSHEDVSKHLRKFHEYFDNVCQVCVFAVAFASDVNRVRRIRALLKILEYVDLEISLVNSSNDKLNSNVTSNTSSYFQLVYSSWIQYMTMLVKNIDEITEPVSFLCVTINRMKKSMNTINGMLKGSNTRHEVDIVEAYHMITGHTTRTLQILQTTNEVNLVSNAHQLQTAHSATVKTFKDLEIDWDNGENQRRFRKHCGITIACVQKALKEIKNQKQPAEIDDEVKEQTEAEEELTLTDMTVTRRIETRKRSDSKMDTAMEGFQGLSLGLTEILENLTTENDESQLSKTSDQTLTFEMETSRKKMVVNLPNDEDEQEENFADFGSQFVDTMQRLLDLEDVQHKMDDIAALNTT